MSCVKVIAMRHHAFPEKGKFYLSKLVDYPKKRYFVNRIKDYCLCNHIITHYHSYCRQTLWIYNVGWFNVHTGQNPGTLARSNHPTKGSYHFLENLSFHIFWLMATIMKTDTNNVFLIFYRHIFSDGICSKICSSQYCLEEINKKMGKTHLVVKQLYDRIYVNFSLNFFNCVSKALFKPIF